MMHPVLGEVLYDENSVADTLYFVYTGEVELLKLKENLNY